MFDPLLAPVVLWFAPVLGAIVGSFVNVCIHRLPREARSVVLPPSHCPTCGSTLAWWQNVPILSYLVLLGKCRACRCRISPVYPLVEALSAFLFWGLARLFVDGSLRFEELAGSAAPLWEKMGVLAVSFALAAALLVATFVDIRFRIIPDEVTVLAVFPAVLASCLFPSLHDSLPTDVFLDRNLAGLAASLFGAAVGAGSIYAIGLVGKTLLRKEVMGFGDVKLMAFLGAVLGWKGALLAFFLACIVGAVIGIFALLATRDHYTPFGPFLAIGAGASFLAQGKILHYALEVIPQWVLERSLG